MAGIFLTRRDFVKHSCFATASMALSGCGSIFNGPGGQLNEDFFFIQMADPQLFWGTAELWQEAIDHANRLKPAFVVVSGDLVNNAGEQENLDPVEDEKRASAYLEIAGSLDASIPLFNVAGNHDVCNIPSVETYEWYRQRFGELWYSFVRNNCLFITLESNILKQPKGIASMADKQISWLKETLGGAEGKNYNHKIVFMHHPMCIKSIDEPEQYFTMPVDMRNELLEVFGRHNVSAVFSGHYHRNAYVDADGIELVTTSSTGKPLGDDPVGFRIVKVNPEKIEHKYYSYQQMPESIQPALL